MNWYHLFPEAIEKPVILAIFVITFGLILYRRINIAYISIASAIVLILLGLASPDEAFLKMVNWDVLAIYWGYGMLAFLFLESKVTVFLANHILSLVKREKYALLTICILAMALSSFMANPVVVIMLAPLAIELATRLNGSLFLYLIALSASSNIVTTVTMVADPPALILAASTGMEFLDFYWFQDKLGLGTLSIIGILAAISIYFFQFRSLNRKVEIKQEAIKLAWGPLLLFFSSVLALALVPWHSLEAWDHPGLVGLALGVLCLTLGKSKVKTFIKEFDWASLAFLAGIFILIGTLNSAGILSALVSWLGSTGLKNPAVYMALFVWVSVLLSSFIDNVPYTVLMIPICAGIARTLGVNPYPFYFGMLVGTGMGGNLTPVGATANVLACGMLEKRGYKIDFLKYAVIAVPFSIVAVAVVHVLLQLIWLK